MWLNDLWEVAIAGTEKPLVELDRLDKLHIPYTVYDMMREFGWLPIFAKSNTEQTGTLKKEQELTEQFRQWMNHQMTARGLTILPDDQRLPRSLWSQEMAKRWHTLGGHSNHIVYCQYEDLVFIVRYLQRFDKLAGYTKKRRSQVDLRGLAKRVAPIIARDCKRFLKDTWGEPLYRGSKSTIKYFRKGFVRQDRQSISDDSGMYQWIDEQMIHHGYTAHRSNSLLCTGDLEIAQSYGRAAAIFMIGDYWFSWHLYMNDYYHKIEELEREIEFHDNREDALRYHMREVISGYSTEKNSSLANAISSQNEIMITNKLGYYAVDISLESYVFEELRKLKVIIAPAR